MGNYVALLDVVLQKKMIMDRKEWWIQNINSINKLSIEKRRLWREYVDSDNEEVLKQYQIAYNNWIDAINDDKTRN